MDNGENGDLSQSVPVHVEVESELEEEAVAAQLHQTVDVTAEVTL